MRQSPVNTYKQEVLEHLADIEETILDLEQNPGSKEYMNRLFRSIHTIKGSGSMFGFDDIVGFTHHLETVLDHVRAGKIEVTNKLIDLTLASADHIKAMISDEKEPLANEIESRCEIIRQLQNLLPGPVENKDVFEKFCADIFDLTEINSNSDTLDVKKKAADYRVIFHPDPDIMKNGTEPVILVKELCHLGKHTITPVLSSIPPLKNLIPENCYFSWEILLNTACDINTIKDIFIFVEEKSRITITPVKENFLQDKERSSLKNKSPAIKERTDLIKKNPETEKGIRVPSEKLDMLMNLVGELVINQAAISQIADTSNKSARQLNNMGMAGIVEILEQFEQELLFSFETLEQGKQNLSDIIETFEQFKHKILNHFEYFEKLGYELAAPVENLDRLTRELKDCVLDIRMIPIGTIFGKFKRLVRDLSEQLGKKIDLITKGADTEIDKTIIEGLNDPIIHLIRNSIDHGISTPETRKKYGKNPKGTICLNAAQKGDRIIISIEDDGMGIDTDIVKEKAVQRGLISHDSDMAEQDIFNLIFIPGFSTINKITNVSGRGVGMDVVKRQIDSLGGTVSIESEKGSFTRVILSLPLTLAIIDGLLIRVGNNAFVLPLANVLECMELRDNSFGRNKNRNMILVHDRMIPFVRLRDFFNISGKTPLVERIIITKADNTQIGIAADEIIGSIQTIIKSLGCCKKIESISGASVLGNGSIALIIDIPGLIRSVLEK